MVTEPRAPKQVDGLLEKIADTALDDDYYVVRSGPGQHAREFNTVLTGTVLAVFALLVAVAAIQTRSDRPATERERATLIDDIASRKQVVADREATADRLREQVTDLKASVVGFDAAYEELRMLASDRAAAGPGLRVRTSPAPTPDGDITDRDLQTLINGLWYAGAEAISVNGKRIGSLTSIRQAGGIVKVNFQSIGPPYEILVIGDPDSLEDRFAQSAEGRQWRDRHDDDGVPFDVTRSDDLSLEAAPKDRLTILHATAVEEDSP
jgi:uncharacterized protein YlxW (UPF0749 family)